MECDCFLLVVIDTTIYSELACMWHFMEFSSGFSKQFKGLALAMLHGWSFWCPTECLCIAWGSWKSKHLDLSLGLFFLCSFIFSRLFKNFNCNELLSINRACLFSKVMNCSSVEGGSTWFILLLFLDIFLLCLWFIYIMWSGMPRPFATAFIRISYRCSKATGN